MVRAANPLRRFRVPGVLLIVVFLAGTLGYMAIERWGALDSLYMVLITVSTVGYGEVHPLSPAGRIFTSILIVGGITTALYAFAIFTEMLAQGQIPAYRRQRSLIRKVDALKNHFIVCGYGRIGTRIIQEFESHGTANVVVDNNPEAVGRLEREGRLYLEGDAADEEILRAAGIERARGLISAVDSDERAVYVVLAARALAPKLYIVAGGGRPASIRRLELAGADRVVSPYQMAGHQMAELAVRPALIEVMDFLYHGGTQIAVEELMVTAGHRVVGRTLRESGLLQEGGAQLLALRRRDGTLHVNPGPDLKLEEGDLIVALGSEEQLAATAARLQ
jgi:voltage-gated potassium channel